ncbi:MAG TPA: radical SAM protein [Nocardioides sp.]|jgi:uncharacterized protein|nr:radical SAM protein [Nocardioides sp.]
MRQSRYNVAVERGDRTWVHNGVSGQVFAVDSGEWSGVLAFLDGDYTHMPTVETLRHLTVARMLVNDDADELGVLERRYRAATSDRSSFGLTIVSSLGCNFDCPYCFEDKPAAILDAETERLLMEVLEAQLDTIERFHVTWYGGEPLLARDRIDSLSQGFIERTKAAEVEYAAAIVTNGYLLTPDVARRLTALQVRRAQITLDGPAETHDRMRPLRSGRGTFDVVMDNVVACADLLPISIRVNLDASNAGEYVRLLDLLVERGLSGRVTVHPGQIVAYPDQAGAPSETYRPHCFTMPEFAQVEREFLAAAYERGLAKPRLPKPIGSPCTAVRTNELVVGARGELYKCYDNVGDPREVIGHLRSWQDPNDRVLKWLRYDPFADEGCRSCVALPTCMGGCAHNEMTFPGDSKCSTFRLTHRRQVEEYAAAAEVGDVRAHASLPIVSVS